MGNLLVAPAIVTTTRRHVKQGEFLLLSGIDRQF
jgi:hypothetical protein